MVAAILLMIAIFWLIVATPAIANIYWLRSENKKFRKENESNENKFKI